MTIEEARKVAAICSTADGGCVVCVAGLCELLGEDFAEFSWYYSEEDGIIRVEQTGD